MRSLLFLACVVIINISDITCQATFRDATVEVMGNREIHSTIAVAIDDINGDKMDDLILLDNGQELVTFTQSERGHNFDYKYHQLVSFDSEWAIMTGDINNDGVPEVLSSGNENGTEVLFKNENQKYLTSYNTRYIYSQNTNLIDFNGDGLLDFFACNDEGESLTFINDGNNKLIETKIIDFKTTETDDMSGNYSSIFSDVDNDGDLDLYIGKCRAGVTDPTDPRRINTLYINQGDGSYTEEGSARGVAIADQSWSVDFGDIDNDGDLDLFVANHDNTHDLLLNDGNGYFTNFDYTPGGISSYAIQSFFADFDNNGWQDIFVTEAQSSFILYNDNMVFNRVDISFNNRKPFTGATGDLNSDGFLDLYLGFAVGFTNPSGDRDKVLLNNGNSNNYIQINLEGTTINRDAIGARAYIYAGDQIFMREVTAGKSYGIQNSTLCHIGLGDIDVIDSLVVRWNENAYLHYYNVDVNSFYHVTQDGNVTKRIEMDDFIACSGDPVMVSAPSGYDSYQWNNGATGQVISSFVGEVLQFEAIKNGWTSYSSFFTVVEEDIEVADILPLAYIVACAGDEVVLSAPSSIDYLWSTGNTSQEISLTNDEIVTVDLTTPCGVYSSMSTEVKFIDIMPVITTDTVIKGEQASLSVIGSNPMWFLSEESSDPLSLDFVYVTEPLFNDTVFYVEIGELGFAFDDSLLYNIPAFDVSDSLFVKNDSLSLEIKDLIMLHSFSVNSGFEGNIKLLILKDDGSTYAQIDKFLDFGVNTISIEKLMVPGQYLLTTDKQVNIITNGFEGPKLSYGDTLGMDMMDIRGAVEIGSSKLHLGKVPYFFDWKISYGYYSCRNRFEVPVKVNPMVSTKNENLTDFVFYPIPARDYLTVRLPSDDSFDLEIYTLEGILIMSVNNIYNGNHIDITSIKPGSYIACLSNKSNVLSRMIIIY